MSRRVRKTPVSRTNTRQSLFFRAEALATRRDDQSFGRGHEDARITTLERPGAHAPAKSLSSPSAHSAHSAASAFEVVLKHAARVSAFAGIEVGLALAFVLAPEALKELRRASTLAA